MKSFVHLFKGGRVRDDLAKPTSGVPRSWHDLKGGAHELRREAALPSCQLSPAEAAFRAAREAGRAIPLSWEIKDFPTHGEPRAVRAGVGPWTFPLPPVSYRKRHLAVRSRVCLKTPKHCLLCPEMVFSASKILEKRKPFLRFFP